MKVMPSPAAASTAARTRAAARDPAAGVAERISSDPVTALTFNPFRGTPRVYRFAADDALDACGPAESERAPYRPLGMSWNRE
ncbi:hypothetical protein GCM10009847_05620 [Leucobacter tardus]